MQDVESSQILQIGYDPETLKARVLFKKKDGSPGATYEYDNVPQEAVTDIVNAGQRQGQQFNAALEYWGVRLQETLMAQPLPTNTGVITSGLLRAAVALQVGIVYGLQRRGRSRYRGHEGHRGCGEGNRAASAGTEEDVLRRSGTAATKKKAKVIASRRIAGSTTGD